MTGRDDFDADLDRLVCRSTGASSVVDVKVVQSLWSGYGQILRCFLKGASEPSVVVKHVRWPDQRNHPYGWTSDLSHERKLRSYRVESAWYENYADRCTAACRVPRRLALETGPDEMAMVLEDLDASGFAGRRAGVNAHELDACLSWLANLHATFMGESPEGLWPTGTYWHLATRPDEFEEMDAGPLTVNAALIDRRLAESPFQTIVHGDAKLANFCFSDDGRRAAAVDFQYAGGGCGMKDVAYFISSCLDEDECERMAPALLDRYFELLSDALEVSGKSIDRAALEADWRALYSFAWADFSRFLQGWSPDHWKLHRYSERLVGEVLETLPTSNALELTAEDLKALAELAIVAATEAGELIARSRPGQVEYKADAESLASQVVTEIDRRSEALILEHLTPTLERFGLGLLTEEREDDGGRFASSHFWCIDPLDGTLPFIEGVPGYAVSIALVRRDGTPLIGVVYDPVESTTWHAIAGAGAFRDGRPWVDVVQPPEGELSVFADRSFVARDDYDALLAQLDAIARARGLVGVNVHATAGAVMNACGVLGYPPACYLKFPAPSGGGSLWDFAATACIFAEASAIATDIYGDALDLNRVDSTFMNHRGVLFATDAALAVQLRRLADGVIDVS